jgi:hypothetical protein
MVNKHNQIRNRKICSRNLLVTNVTFNASPMLSALQPGPATNTWSIKQQICLIQVKAFIARYQNAKPAITFGNNG